jgi:hypothetical protein
MGKQKETKKEEKTESKSYSYDKIDLGTGLNDISFKNNQVKMIRDLQNENVRLKEMAGRGKARQASMPKIQGLGTLKGNLGMQFRGGSEE